MTLTKNTSWRGPVLFAILCALPPQTRAQSPRQWPDSFQSRLEILALMQTLNAEILASRSATVTLETWCAEHAMAGTPKVVAEPANDGEKAPTAEQLAQLGVKSASEVRHRHVRLRCGAHVLSEADNWYVPARLTPEMNRLLDTTDTSFGTVVRPLHPYRETLAVKILWSPLPKGWERDAEPKPPRPMKPLVIPKALFEHRAILYTADHQPFSEVDEVYQSEVLNFSRPTAAARQ